MFYVRTGDRLQRTSTWRDNLEGGLDYLKSVVIDDKLGIAAELEADMQHVVDTYACEWKKPSRIRDAQALPPLRQQRQGRRERAVHGRTRPDPPGHHRRTQARYSYRSQGSLRRS
jgi:hypothetical protein